MIFYDHLFYGRLSALDRSFSPSNLPSSSIRQCKYDLFPFRTSAPCWFYGDESGCKLLCSKVILCFSSHITQMFGNFRWYNTRYSNHFEVKPLQFEIKMANIIKTSIRKIMSRFSFQITFIAQRNKPRP